jgi:hypothetical protein
MREPKQLFLLLVLFLLWGCSNPVPTVTPTRPAPEATLALAATTAPLPSLVPTFTPEPTPSPLSVATPSPQLTRATASTESSPTPAFDEPVVEFRYTIPALGLDRRLEGNVASQIIAVDETTQRAVQRNNQASILLELQQSLPHLELAPLPEECDRCVQFQYELPISGESDEGWLQDPVFLASVDNFLTVLLGPHFPPETVVGLRRSASAYAPAHTTALTADGRLWTWLATEEEVDEPDSPEAVVSVLQERFNALPLSELEERYVIDCTGMPVETLLLNPEDGEARQVRIVCPSFSLPSTLLPLYLPLDAVLEEELAGVEGPVRPPSAFPLTALLQYRRPDGSRLTLYQDGSAVALDAADRAYTRTLTSMRVISLTASLLDSGRLQPDLSTFQTQAGTTVTATVQPTPQQATSILVVRGPEGVYDAALSSTADFPALAELNALLDSLLGREATEPEQTGTPPSPPETDTPQPAPATNTPQATQMETPEPTATPTASSG